MRWFNAPLAQPTSAERIRTILTAADSMTVVTDEGRTEVSRLGRGGMAEHIHLHPVEYGAGEPGGSGPGIIRAVLEFTDVAPTAVRDRVRARVLLAGWLLPEGEHAGTDGSRCMEFERAVHPGRPAVPDRGARGAGCDAARGLAGHHGCARR
ncbi:hypothetical protein ACWDR0_32375, partial [Streptomyces sp. NPDC003691]